MTEDFITNYLRGLASTEPQQRTISIMTGSRGNAMINKAMRQIPIRENLKAAKDLGAVSAIRFEKLLNMLDHDDEEIQKIAEKIILELKI
jgi:hypothetical protein